MLKTFCGHSSFKGFQKFKSAMYSTGSIANANEKSKGSNYANRRKSIDFSSEMKLIRSLYPSLVNELLDKQLVYHQNRPEIRDRYVHLMNYTSNLEDKCYSTAVMAIRAYKLLEKPSLLTEENIKLAGILAWCFRWLDSSMLVDDDIIDNSVYRYNKTVWFRLPDVGINAAIMDSSFLTANVTYLLLKYFKNHPQYFKIHEEILKTYSTACLSTTMEIRQYKLHEFVKQENVIKTYPFTVPVVISSMLLANIVDERLHSIAKGILIDIARFIKAEDDYQCVYGQIEKDCTDAAEGRITWQAIQVAKRGTEAQKKLFEENYGKDDKQSLSKIYEIYQEMNLKDNFIQYKEDFYENMYKRIEDLPKELSPQLFLDVLDYAISGTIQA